MKKLILIIGLAAMMLSSRAQGFAYLPATSPWRIAWEFDNRVDIPWQFELYYDDAKVATLTPAEYSVDATNGTERTFSAPALGVILGLTKVTLVAVDPAGQRSDHSLPLTTDGLGKPSAPHNLAKR